VVYNGVCEGEVGDAVTGEVLDFVSMNGLLADVLGDMLGSTLSRTPVDVVTEAGDDEDSELDGLGDGDELERVATDSQLV
jgi:hypothetical protein